MHRIGRASNMLECLDGLGGSVLRVRVAGDPAGSPVEHAEGSALMMPAFAFFITDDDVVGRDEVAEGGWAVERRFRKVSMAYPSALVSLGLATNADRAPRIFWIVC